MPDKTVVLCTVALTPELLGDATPRLKSFADGGRDGAARRRHARRHRDRAEHLPDRPAAERARRGRQRLAVPGHDGGAAVAAVEPARAGAEGVGGGAGTITCANLFWWFAMYSSADVTVTPRPMYPADGRKIPDCYTKPGDLRDELQAELGPVPAVQVLGPGARRSTRRSGSPRRPSWSTRSSTRR